MGRLGRVLFSLLVLATASWSGMPAAEAGGASFIMDQRSYQPGDWAVGRTGINWAHNPMLGTPEDGPYYAYLVPMASMETVTAWPGDPASLPGAVFVDEVEVVEGPIEIAPGFRMGPHGATVEFEVPDLPDGQYALRHCNRPCTTALADITGGGLWIGPPPPPPPPSPEPPSPVRDAPLSVSTTTSPMSPGTSVATATSDPTDPTTSTVTDRTDQTDQLVAGGGQPGDDGSGRSGGPGLLADVSLLVLPVALVLLALALVASRSRLRVVSAPAPDGK